MIADRESFKNLRTQLRRDQFAQAALTGLMAGIHPSSPDDIAKLSVELADRLIAELDASLPKSKMAPGFRPSGLQKFVGPAEC